MDHPSFSLPTAALVDNDSIGCRHRIFSDRDTATFFVHRCDDGDVAGGGIDGFHSLWLTPNLRMRGTQHTSEDTTKISTNDGLRK